jgi:hypothetical protein
MNMPRRLLLGLVVGLAAWVNAGCSNDDFIVADLVPAAIEDTAAPAATVTVSKGGVTADDVAVGDEVTADDVAVGDEVTADDVAVGDEVKFLPGTNSTMVVIDGFETNEVFTFRASQNQRLTFALVNGPAPADISVTLVTTGQVTSGVAEMVLPADGVYEVVVSFDQERGEKTTLDMVIDDGDAETLASWTEATEQVLVTEEPYVASSLMWPVFASDQPGTGAANDALARFVTDLDDDWISDASEYAEGRGSYEVSYEVTLVTADLASVRFDFYDYVCCRPYPNYGSVSAVLDLTAGRLIPIGEILDMDQIGEISRLWITELDNQGLIPDIVDLLSGQTPRFDSLTLRPEGVEFGTDRNSLGGGLPGTSTIVSYAQLGDLVNPALAARVPTS